MRLGIPEHLRPYCGGNAAVELEGDSIGAILEDLVVKFPEMSLRALDDGGRLRSHVVMIRNDRILDRRGLSKVRVSDEDDLRLFAAASGG